ncbi:MAG: type II secretion system protein [Burkholderiales bacterium]|nr:type II secretion system protein [Burkholderiales bacterium]
MRKSAGLSLVELIVFIVIVSTAVAGVLGALNLATRSSVDPMIQKQALAIAESLLEEVQLMPFTWCDPDDPQAATATAAVVGPAGCAATVEGIGPEPGETRTGNLTPFDNVNDYHGFVMNGIIDITGNPVPGLGAFNAAVTVAQQALGGIAAAESLLITVTVAGPANTTVTLQGYRTRYAPNATP